MRLEKRAQQSAIALALAPVGAGWVIGSVKAAR